MLCGACDPPCPSLIVSCPTNVSKGEVADFKATVSGDPDTTSGKMIYLWSHSNGKRLSGEGPTLQIQAKGMPGDVITATVRVLGVDPVCNHQATCRTLVSK